MSLLTTDWSVVLARDLEDVDCLQHSFWGGRVVRRLKA